MPWRYPGPKPKAPPASLAELWERLLEMVLIAPFAHLLAWILGGSPQDWDTIEEIQDNLVPALIRLPLRVVVQLIGGIPIIGDGVEDAFAKYLKTTNTTAVFASNTAVGARTVAVQTVFNLTTRRPFWQGLDPTAESSYSYEGLAVRTGEALSTQTLTNTIARISKILVGQDQIRNTLSFGASKTGTPNLYIDLMRWDPEANAWQKIYSSPDLGAMVSGSLNRITVEFSDDGYPMVAGEKYALQWRQAGSGQITLASKTFPVMPAPGFSPGAIGGSRNPTTDPAPASISFATMESYNDGNTPWFEIGSDVGQIEQNRYYPVNFDNRSWQNWVRNAVNSNQLNVNTDGQVEFTGNNDGIQAGTYGSPTRTSKTRVTLDLLESAFWFAYLSAGRDNTTALNGPYLAIHRSRLQLGIGNTELDNMNLSASDWRTGAGSYRLSIEPVSSTAANVFGEKWDGAAWQTIIGAAAVTMPLDAAHRFGGIAIGRAQFLNGSRVDNFILEDW
ncbi:minor tail protein [Gordonia phage ThankyouJordi]|uniref:Minor tail protein n=1 Tax=Gordonia phage ThankyouJordi TaxID=2571252 RepID=A0A4Y6EIB4_9CAUD|nr:minor tail protein [Gordonia phage ThankyouJordi]QCW22210.1 minor tail protein [Gordonia phage WelcomeAyanna]QDF17787.1 minor tail protein [Gordonia phage ThankyouJordi]